MARPKAAPIDRFMRHVSPEPNSGCWLWTGFLHKGYGHFRMTTDTNDTQPPAHRAAWALFVGAIPDALIVCHRCDVRCCVNPEHLFLGTYADNMQDASKKGRMDWKSSVRPGLPRGEHHHDAKLSPRDVIEIRSSPASGSEAAERYGVTQVTISRIRRRLTWRHI